MDFTDILFADYFAFFGFTPAEVGAIRRINTKSAAVPITVGVADGYHYINMLGYVLMTVRVAANGLIVNGRRLEREFRVGSDPVMAIRLAETGVPVPYYSARPVA